MLVLTWNVDGTGKSRLAPEGFAVAEKMASMLDWDREETERQVASYTAEVALSRKWQEA